MSVSDFCGCEQKTLTEDGWIFFTFVINVTVIVTASDRTSKNTLHTFYSGCFVLAGQKRNFEGGKMKN